VGTAVGSSSGGARESSNLCTFGEKAVLNLEDGGITEGVTECATAGPNCERQIGSYCSCIYLEQQKKKKERGKPSP